MKIKTLNMEIKPKMSKEESGACSSAVYAVFEANGANEDDMIICFSAMFMTAIESKLEKIYPGSKNLADKCGFVATKLIGALVEGIKEREEKCNTQS